MVGYTNVEFWGEIKMKMQSWLSSESGKCPVSQDWVNTTQASVDKVEQTLTAKQLSTGRELRQPLTEEAAREPPGDGEIQRPVVAEGQGKTCSHAEGFI